MSFYLWVHDHQYIDSLPNFALLLSLQNEMVQLQRVEAYACLSLQKQQVAFGIHHSSSEYDANNDTEIAFAFPTLFQDVMTFLPVVE